MIGTPGENWTENGDSYTYYDGFNYWTGAPSWWTGYFGGNNDRGEELGLNQIPKKPESGWYYIDFNAAGLSYLKEKAASGKCSFIFGADPEYNYDYIFIDLASSENMDDHRPYLEITYKN
jgi:hypothetical protein